MKFKDVPNTHWAYTVIEEYVKNNVVNGYEDGTFKPNGNITRAEACTIIAKNDPEFKKKVQYTSDFLDCKESDWFYNYVSFCAMKGYIEGFNDSNSKEFKPNNPLTREETATIFARRM